MAKPLLYFLVFPDGRALKYARYKTAEAAWNDPTINVDKTGLLLTDAPDGLKAAPMPLLILLHNLIRPERPVTRFSDRATAEKRLEGVLEVLAKPGIEPAEVEGPVTPDEAFIPDPSKTPEENEAMAAAKKAARKGAKKTRTPRAPKTEISEATVRKVIKMRANGDGWPAILKELGEKSNSFILRIRPLMKKMDKSSVMAIGPGSPNYGKTKKGK